MSIPINVARIFFGSVIHYYEMDKENTEAFIIEIIDGDSGLENYTECLVNVNTSIFLPTALIEHTNLKTGDSIVILPDDLEIRPALNEKFAYILINNFLVKDRAIDDRSLGNIEAILSSKSDAKTKTNSIEKKSQAKQTGFLSDDDFDFPDIPKKTQQNFLSDDSDDIDILKIEFEYNSVHMNTPQGEKADTMVKEIQEKYSLTELRKPPEISADSTDIPHLNDVLDDYDNFIKDFKMGTTIEVSCEVTLLKMYPPTAQGRPYNFYVRDSQKHVIKLTIFDTQKTNLRVLKNTIKDHGQGVILLKGTFTLKGWKNPTNQVITPELIVKPGSTISYLREVSEHFTNPSDFGTYLEFLYSGRKLIDTPKGGITLYTCSYTSGLNNTIPIRSIGEFMYDGNVYRCILDITEDYTPELQQFYIFEGKFNVNKNSNILHLYTSDLQSSPSNIFRKIDHQVNFNIDPIGYTVKPKSIGGTYEEVNVTVKEVKINPRPMCSVSYCYKSISPYDGSENFICTDKHVIDKPGFKNIRIIFTLADSEDITFNIAMNYTLLNNLLAENSQDVIETLENFFTSTAIAYSKSEGPTHSIPEEEQAHFDKVSAELSAVIEQSIGNRYIKLHITPRDSSTNLTPAQKYSRYTLVDITY